MVKTDFILAMIVFYVFLGVLLGLIGREELINNGDFQAPDNPGLLGFITDVAVFFQGLAFSISSFPFWANAILFLPIGLTLLWVILSTFFGVGGGG